MAFKPFIFKKSFTKQFKISAAALGCLLIVFSLIRLGFYLSNLSFFTGLPADDIALSFINGLRFDIAAIFIINSPVLFLYNLPMMPVQKKWYKTTILVLFLIINIIALVISIADYGYFAATQRRLMYELYTMFPDIVRMIPSAVSTHYVLFIIFILGAFVFTYSLIKICKRLDTKIVFSRKPSVEIINFVFLVLLALVVIRGGFQLKPLRQANAFESGSQSLGYLTLNTTYNVVISAFQDVLPDISILPEEEADKIVMDMVKDGNESITDPQYIFMRQKKYPSPPRKLNVVIFIMESWSARYSGAITGGKTSMPFFDSLASQGLLFKNFFATGQRSIEAIPCILTSVPSLYNSSIINSIAEIDRYRGLGAILKEEGYTTSFHHGASVGSMGFDGFSGVAGFSNYYGKEDFLYLPSSAFDGAWGIFDEPFFLETEKILSSYREPFCSVIFSLSSHDPYKIPDDRLELFAQFTNEDEYEHSIRYSDYCLRKFFEAASNKAWFKNTLFIITADHTLFNSRDNFYTTFHIPLLLYTSSGIIARGENNSVASHIDILPTILDILQIPAVHSSMGVSVFSTKKDRYCFERYGNNYCIINEDYVLLNDLEHEIRLYDYKTDPSLKNNLFTSHPETAYDLNIMLLAYIEATTGAIAKDRIYREGR
jgi:phosphoglycerol transferase MdoB-like AlkP superfamily enzyme